MKESRKVFKKIDYDVLDIYWIYAQKKNQSVGLLPDIFNTTQDIYLVENALERDTKLDFESDVEKWMLRSGIDFWHLNIKEIFLHIITPKILTVQNVIVALRKIIMEKTFLLSFQ